GLMMLVEHHIHTELVGELPFVVVSVEQVAGDVGVEQAVRQVDTQRAVVVVPRWVIGLLGEVIDLHGGVLLRLVLRAGRSARWHGQRRAPGERTLAVARDAENARRARWSRTVRP